MSNSDQLDQLQARILSASILQESILRAMSKEQIEQVKAHYVAVFHGADTGLLYSEMSDRVIDYTQKLTAMTARLLDQIALDAKPS